jgi:hypothetical protein
VALALFWFRPIWLKLGRAVVPDDGDPWFNLYILEWGYRSLRRGFAGVWSPPFFHPTRGVLALSDHLLGPAVLSAPLRALTGSEVAPFMLLVVSSFVLGGFVTFWVFRRRGLSAPAAFAAGLVYAAAPFRWDQLSHLAILWAQWLPLLVWAWDELLAGPTPRKAAVFVAAYALQVSGGTSLAYMAHLPLLVLLVLHRAEHGRELASRASLRVLAPTLLASAALAATFFAPYRRVSDELGLARSPEETRAFGATVTSLWQPSARNLYFSPEEWNGTFRAENALFAGFAATILVCIALLAIARRYQARPGERPEPLSRWDRAMLATAAASLLLCFPAVYLTLARAVPGLAGMRVPTRFFAIALLPIAWLAGRGLDHLAPAGATAVRRAAAVALLALLLFDSTPRRLTWVDVPAPESFPRAYHWLAGQRGVTAIVELPFAGSAPGEIDRMLYQTLHGKPLANGYSGYLAPSFLTLQRELSWPLRERRQLELLREHRISHVVVSGMRAGRLAARGRLVPMDAALTEGPGREAELVYSDEHNLVYRLLPAG